MSGRFRRLTEMNFIDYEEYSIENTSHELSDSFIDFYDDKDNEELRDAIFDIVFYEDDEYSLYDLLELTAIRLSENDVDERMEFRELMLQPLLDIDENEDPDKIVFGITVIETTMDEIQNRLRAEDSENDTNLEIESEQLMDELRAIAGSQTTHSYIRGKAIHYLGKNYSDNNKTQLLGFLANTNNTIVKNAGRGIRNYIKFIDESEKTDFVPGLIQAIKGRKNNSVLRPGYDGSGPDDYMSEAIAIKPVMNALGMINTLEAQNYLFDLLEDTQDEEVAQQCLYALSLQQSKSRLNFILGNLHSSLFDSVKSDQETLLAGIVLENDSLLTELKNDPDIDTQKNYLTALRLTHKTVVGSEIERIKEMLGNPDRDLRLEAVKTLHMLLPFSEQQQVFGEHKQDETDEVIKWQIEKYIGL